MLPSPATAAGVQQFVNCTIVSNRAGGLGGGLYLQAGDTGNLFNTLIAANIAPVVSNCYLASTNWTIWHCCSIPLLPVTNNLDADPLFMDAPGNDWRLSGASPCRDAGSTAPSMYTDEDLAGVPRVLYGVVDIGAYEYAEGLWRTFSAEPVRVLVDEPVAFTSTVGGTNVSGVYYVWDFENNGAGDVQGLGSNAPQWRYQSEGIYSVSLCVSNAASEGAQYMRTDYINVVPEGGLGLAGAAVLFTMYNLRFTIWGRRRRT